MERVVFHVDMDAFYASVEERDRPALRGKPVVIGADPKAGLGRGVACTANYVARRYGIGSAMPIATAYRACPHAVFLRPDFPRYKEASRKVMAVLEAYADELEVVGMDEAYLDVTEAVQGDFGFARSYALSLQAAVLRATGLGCSIGIAPNKSVAKIASDRRKPHGVMRVAPDELEAFLAPLPAKLVHGCGPKTAARLEEDGIHTIGDLADAEPRLLESRFGSHGAWLQRVARGDDPRRVQADRGPSKSRGNERTYGQDERHPAHIRTTAHRLLKGLLEGRDRRAFATVTVKVRYSDFRTMTRAHSFSVPVEPDQDDALDVTARIVDALLDPFLDGTPVRLVGVRLSGFSAPRGQQGLVRFGIHVRDAAHAAFPPGSESPGGARGVDAGPRQLVLA